MPLVDKKVLIAQPQGFRKMNGELARGSDEFQIEDLSLLHKYQKEFNIT